MLIIFTKKEFSCLIASRYSVKNCLNLHENLNCRILSENVEAFSSLVVPASQRRHGSYRENTIILKTDQSLNTVMF